MVAVIGFLWGCSAASGPRRFAIIDETMNSALKLKILKKNVWSSYSDLGYEARQRSRVQEQVNHKIKKNIWQDLKWAVHVHGA